MDLIASFHAHKVKTSFFLTVDGISPDGILYFLFDTGAVCSLVGLNSLFPEENAQRQAFAKVVRDELSAAQISPRPESLRTATNQSILTYPCVCHNVSIEGTDGRDFYFDFSFDNISLPLLGTSFSEDCSYSHTINGELNITGIKADAGKAHYSGRKVLDFDKVWETFANSD